MYNDAQMYGDDVTANDDDQMYDDDMTANDDDQIYDELGVCPQNIFTYSINVSMMDPKHLDRTLWGNIMIRTVDNMITVSSNLDIDDITTFAVYTAALEFMNTGSKYQTTPPSKNRNFHFELAKVVV
jgi:hypothetical protein